MPIHQELSRGRWRTLSLVEQLGNVGSEVGRAVKRQQEGNADSFQKSFDRSLELLDFTIADPRWRKTPKLKEIVRSREVLCDFFFGGNRYNSTAESLERYFFQFAVAARLSR